MEGEGGRKGAESGSRGLFVAVFFLLLLLACLASQQHARVSQGWICSDNCTCCHTEVEVAAQTFYLTQSQYNNCHNASQSQC